MNRFSQSHIQNLQFTTVKMAYVTCLVTKNFTFELPGNAALTDIVVKLKSICFICLIIYEGAK